MANVAGMPWLATAVAFLIRALLIAAGILAVVIWPYCPDLGSILIHLRATITRDESPPNRHAAEGGKLERISVIIPCYNEASTVLRTLHTLYDALDQASDGSLVDVTVVDSASTDDSRSIVEGCGIPGVSCIAFSGHGAAATPPKLLVEQWVKIQVADACADQLLP